MIKAVLIDDERHSRNLLRKMLVDFCEGVSVIGEAHSVSSGVELLKKVQPDVILLDIEMSDGDGFDVLNAFNYIHPPVIFVTGYDQYAIKAFEVHAVDYLLKPYGKKRFESTLQRILKNHTNVIPLAEELLQKETEFPSKVILHKGARKIMVQVADIVYAEAFGDYTKVFTKTSEFLATRGISELKKTFDPRLFIRLHRSHFVNTNAIIELKKIDRYYYVFLDNGERIKVSETYLPDIKNIVL